MRISSGENEGEQSLVRKIEMFVISGVRNNESSLYYDIRPTLYKYVVQINNLNVDRNRTV